MPSAFVIFPQDYFGKLYAFYYSILLFRIIYFSSVKFHGRSDRDYIKSIDYFKGSMAFLTILIFQPRACDVFHFRIIFTLLMLCFCAI